MSAITNEFLKSVHNCTHKTLTNTVLSSKIQCQSHLKIQYYSLKHEKSSAKHSFKVPQNQYVLLASRLSHHKIFTVIGGQVSRPPVDHHQWRHCGWWMDIRINGPPPNDRDNSGRVKDKNDKKRWIKARLDWLHCRTPSLQLVRRRSECLCDSPATWIRTVHSLPTIDSPVGRSACQPDEDQ